MLPYVTKIIGQKLIDVVFQNKDYLYLYRRVCVCPCVCVCVYPSDGIHVVACGPIGTKFCTHMQIHLQMVVSLIKISPVLPKGGLGGF